LDLAKRRQLIRNRIENCSRKASNFLDEEILETNKNTEINIAEHEEESEHEESDWVASDDIPVDPEKQALLFPSGVPTGDRGNYPRLASLLKKEFKLREGQANDALQKIKEALSYKAWHIKSKVRYAAGNRQTGRAWDGVHSLNRKITRYRTIYNRSRSVMISIKNFNEVNIRYPVLTKEQCRTSTTVTDPNAPGQSRAKLAWFWQPTPFEDDQVPTLSVNEDEYMIECKFFFYFFLPLLNSTSVYRLHWLRARAQANRWTEELKLTHHEMSWTVRFYMYMAKKWEFRRSLRNSNGHHAYAGKQIVMWNELGRVADSLFQENNPTYSSIWHGVPPVPFG
jgi:hypothetical protein